MWRAAHDQPVVYEEGRSDSHSEADALVHVQLICGPAKDALEGLHCTEEHEAHGMQTGLEIVKSSIDFSCERLMRWQDPQLADRCGRSYRALADSSPPPALHAASPPPKPQPAPSH
jgi:hypothetical protein